MRAAQRCTPDANMIEQCKALSSELDTLHPQEESYWFLRAREIELRDGDKNSKYFHHKASSRWRRNQIKGLFDENGIWKTNATDLERLITAYYEQLLSTSSPSDFEAALAGVGTKVTTRMNDILDVEPTTEEIKEATFQMHPTKAPSTDGFHALFFRKFWDIVGHEVVFMVKKW